MIAKITTSEKLYGTLNYNQQKVDAQEARVLGVNGMLESMTGEYRLHDFVSAIKERIDLNAETQKKATKKNIVHISLNPSPKDVLTDEQLLAIGREYMKRMNFGEQPYVIFKHEDIERHHIHIVSTNIQTDGNRMNDKNNFLQSKEITNDLEHKYHLAPADVKQDNTIWTPDKVNVEKGRIRYQIKNVTKHLLDEYKFQTVNELKTALLLYNIQMNEVAGVQNDGTPFRGIIYQATDGVNSVSTPIKSSIIGKDYGIKTIEKKIKQTEENLTKQGKKSLCENSTKQILKDCIAKSRNWDDMFENLHKNNIDIYFHKNDTGRIYGTTIADHNEKVIINGSKLGKEFAANAFQTLFEQWATQQPIQQTNNDTAAEEITTAKADVYNTNVNVGVGGTKAEEASPRNDYGMSSDDGGSKWYINDTADSSEPPPLPPPPETEDAGFMDFFTSDNADVFASMLGSLFSFDDEHQQHYIPSEEERKNKRKGKRKKPRYW
jgi:hypothetical protein